MELNTTIIAVIAVTSVLLNIFTITRSITKKNQPATRHQDSIASEAQTGNGKYVQTRSGMYKKIITPRQFAGRREKPQEGYNDGHMAGLLTGMLVSDILDDDTPARSTSSASRSPSDEPHSRSPVSGYSGRSSRSSDHISSDYDGGGDSSSDDGNVDY
jgi:hypothetical protein